MNTITKHCYSERYYELYSISNKVILSDVMNTISNYVILSNGIIAIFKNVIIMDGCYEYYL